MSDTTPSSSTDAGSATKDGGGDAKAAAQPAPAPPNPAPAPTPAPAPPAPAVDPMKTELDLLQQQIAAGDAAKVKLQALKPLFDKKAKVIADYSAQRPSLVARWQTVRCEVLHLIKQVADERPDWSKAVHDGVCPQLAAIKDQTDKLAQLQQELVLLKPTSDAADTDQKRAKADLAAKQKASADWFDISNAIGKKLTDLEGRIAALKKSPAPRTSPASLYIIFFDLLPDVLAIAPTDAPNDIKELSAFQDQLKDCPPANPKPPGPQLVPVDGLSAALNQAKADEAAAEDAVAAAEGAIADKAKAVDTAAAARSAAIANLTVQPAPAPAPAVA